RQRRFPPFVSRPRRGARHGLLEGVAGEDAEGDGELALDGDARELVRDLRGEDVKVRRLAADQTTEGDDGVRVENVDRRGDLERAGEATEPDVVVLRALAAEAIDRAGEQAAHDLVVEAAGHDGEAHSPGIQMPFETTR